MSGLKRKARELSEQGLSAAVGEVAARMVSATVGRYDAQATVDGQLDDLKRLVVIIHSAVEVADGVHIRSWWLRQWLWRLRDAATDGDEVLRLFRERQLRGAEEANTQQAVSTLWDAARRVLRSVKALLMFAVAGDEDVERLSRTVARLEKVAAGIGDFLQLIELEIRLTLPMPQPQPLPFGRCLEVNVDGIISRRLEVDVYGISHEKYTARRKRIVLLMVKRYIRQVIDKFRATARSAAAASPPCYADRLRDLVSEIRYAILSSDDDMEMELLQGRPWLAEWSRGLQAVADRADRVLQLAAPVAIAGENGDDEVKRTRKSLEAAAAHLHDFGKVFMINRLREEAANICTEET